MFQYYFRRIFEMIKRTVRDQVYTLDTYLKYVNDGDICEHADVQRMAGNFDTKEVNEIVYTVLTLDHIPEIILAECIEDGRTYIVDGLQRTTMLKLFRFGNHKITSSIDNSIVEYSKKSCDKNGKIIKNERNQVVFEDAEFNIKNRTYESLPPELKKVFNDFQLRFAIHENCTKKRISELIKRYNYHKGMTTPQRALTYMYKYGGMVKEILKKKFFIECTGYKEREKINGTMERVVTESIMYMFHADNWKKQSKAVCEFLNENSSEEEFEKFKEIVNRLGVIVTPEFNKVFISKNSFIWFKLFKTFTEYNLGDELFANFICEFNNTLKNKVINGIEYKDLVDITYSKLDKETGTKDKVLIIAKTQILETLMKEYLHIEEPEKVDDEESFISDVVEIDKLEVHENMELYMDTLNGDYGLKEKCIKYGSKLLDTQNNISLLALVAYSYKIVQDLDDWLIEYAKNNNTYFMDQKRNYYHMRREFDEYLRREAAA